MVVVRNSSSNSSESSCSARILLYRNLTRYSRLVYGQYTESNVHSYAKQKIGATVVHT